MALIFCIIVADKLLLTLPDHRPVGVFDLCGIARTVFLLLHFNVKLLLVHRKAIFAANELRQVKWEAVSVEKPEGLRAVKHRFLVFSQLFHRLIEHIDAFVERTQKRILFLFHHTGNQLALRRQFGVGPTHFLNHCGQQFIEERLTLLEESVGIAYRTAQDAANDVARLRIARQLSVGDAECHGP